MYVYQADTYCDSCGEAIRARLTEEGHAPDDPDDEYSFDSDHFPKYALEEETDGPDHCAAGGDCLEGIELELPADAVLVGAETRRIGALLSDGLTEEGTRYLAEMLAEEPRTDYQRALHAYWAETFREELESV